MNQLVGKFRVENTEISVINHSSLINRDESIRILRVIVAVVNQFKQLVVHQPSVIFHLVDYDSTGHHVVHGTETGTYGWTRMDIPNCPVFLIAKAILHDKQIKNTILHELKHFHDFTKSEEIKRARVSRNKLIALASRVAYIKHNARTESKPKAWFDLRTYYGCFFRALQFEGLATYVEKQLPLTKSNYHILLDKAIKHAKNLAHIWLNKLTIEDFTTNRDMLEFPNAARYTIGAFMVFSLVFHHVKTVDEITHMSYIEFIKTYEAVACSHFEPVLVSITSGKGLLDYKRLLEEARKELLS